MAINRITINYFGTCYFPRIIGDLRAFDICLLVMVSGNCYSYKENNY